MYAFIASHISSSENKALFLSHILYAGLRTQALQVLKANLPTRSPGFGTQVDIWKPRHQGTVGAPAAAGWV